MSCHFKKRIDVILALISLGVVRKMATTHAVPARDVFWNQGYGDSVSACPISVLVGWLHYNKVLIFNFFLGKIERELQAKSLNYL